MTIIKPDVYTCEPNHESKSLNFNVFVVEISCPEYISLVRTPAIGKINAGGIVLVCKY